jgi:Patatin-like phospholipase
MEDSHYQIVVLSGGGAKGPYGLGVLLGLDKYIAERKKKVTRLYAGTSVGALNATLAAQGDLEGLSKLYASLRTKDVLGVDSPHVSKWKMPFYLGRRPFYYFDNCALRKTIEKHASFQTLQDAHLLVCVTNYLSGELETFYSSKLVDDFVARDSQRPDEARRLRKYSRIESQEHLVDVLLASAAIPFYFPPVRIGKSTYVDGGVGNNTPLRQAAYMGRFLRQAGYKLEPPVCIINDPDRFKIEPTADSMDVFGVVRRTMDIFHNELVRDSLITWERINNSVAASSERENLISSHIGGMEGVPLETRQKLQRQVSEVLQATNAVTPRLDMPLLEVRPSTPLLENILEFDPNKSAALKKHGTADFLKMLCDKNMISAENRRRWLEEIE